jgi:hypothetical protein
MAARPGYAPPDPRNPFTNPPLPQQYPQQYQQRRRDYDAESDFSDPYGSRNGSSAQLTAHSHHDNHGQYDSPCECDTLFSDSYIFLLSPMRVRRSLSLYLVLFLVSLCRPTL